MNILTAFRVVTRLVPFAAPNNIWALWKVSRLRTPYEGDESHSAEQIIQKYGRFTSKAFAESQANAKEAIYVVIPCYNEGLHLPSLLVALARNSNVVPIVVNNNSSDNTPDVGAAMGAIVLDQPTGKKMAATQCGLAYARKKFNASRVLFTDGDSLPVSNWAKTMDDQLKSLDTGSGAAVFGSAIYMFGKSRVADFAITLLGLTYEIMRTIRGELPIARGHNYGVSFDSRGKLVRAINSLDPTSFAGSQQRTPDDAQILRALDNAGAVLRYTSSAKTWIVTTNDRIRSMHDVRRSLRRGVSHVDITSESYDQEYGRSDNHA